MQISLTRVGMFMKALPKKEEVKRLVSTYKVCAFFRSGTSGEVCQRSSKQSHLTLCTYSRFKKLTPVQMLVGYDILGVFMILELNKGLRLHSRLEVPTYR